MDRLQHDIRIALRGFRRTPSFTTTAILILAVGIGMAVAMFTVYDAVLVRIRERVGELPHETHGIAERPRAISR